jgi:hypothetical protein
MAVDKGVVHGTTWHGLPQYVQQDRPVSPEQAKEVMNYPMEKRQLFRMVKGVSTPAKAWEIVRTDSDTPLVPHVGEDFTVMSNLKLFDYINSTVLSEFQDITIESVGTLFGGATAFVNLAVGEFQVKGDISKSVSRLMYYNPLGKGKYKVCAHNVRVVCNNTLRLATSESIASGLLRMVSHTKNAEQGIKAAMSEILAVREEFRKEKELLDVLAAYEATTARIEAFFDAWMPKGKDDSQKKDSRRTNVIAGIMDQFNTDQGIKGDNFYGLLNAITYVKDHEIPNRGNDVASVAWDGIVGGRSDDKLDALNVMQTMVAA